MANTKLNVDKPASLTSSGPVTFFQPTADVVVDEEGKAPSTQDGSALELQRKQMEDFAKAEAEKDVVKEQEEKDLKAAASELATAKGVSKMQALEELKGDDKEFDKAVSAAVEKKKGTKVAPVVKDEAKPKSSNASSQKSEAEQKK